MQFDTLQARLIADSGLDYPRLPNVRRWERPFRGAVFNQGLATVIPTLYTVPNGRLAILTEWWWKACDPACYWRAFVNLLINESPVNPLELSNETDMVTRQWYPRDLHRGLSSLDRVSVNFFTEFNPIDPGTWSGQLFTFIAGWEFDPLQEWQAGRHGANARMELP